ncbi:Heat shock 70 kDa protein A [Dirofilaria immitis]|nr:Heat shock 70 kDa protein A [Dirofilaria immitis]
MDFLMELLQLKNKISADDRKKIEDKCNETAEKDEFEHEQKELETLCYPITKMYQIQNPVECPVIPNTLIWPCSKSEDAILAECLTTDDFSLWLLLIIAINVLLEEDALSLPTEHSLIFQNILCVLHIKELNGDRIIVRSDFGTMLGWMNI